MPLSCPPFVAEHKLHGGRASVSPPANKAFEGLGDRRTLLVLLEEVRRNLGWCHHLICSYSWNPIACYIDWELIKCLCAIVPGTSWGLVGQTWPGWAAPSP